MDQPQPQESHEQGSESEYGFSRCHAHPDVETGLACGRCGTYICPRCMIQTPVGARCNECARVTKHPTFDVKPTYYLRAAVAGAVVAVVAALVWGLLLPIGILFLGVGFLVGEAISIASNRKRGQGLVTIAVVSMAIAVIVSGYWPSTNPINALFWLLWGGSSFYLAISRVR